MSKSLTLENPAVDTDVRAQLVDLLSDYVHALDDGDIDRWPHFFTEEAIYHVSTRENQDEGLPIGIIRCVGRGMMLDRVKAFHTANIYEPHSYNHVIGQPIISAGVEADTFVSRCNFQIVRIMQNGRMDLFATGKYCDVLTFEDGSPRIRRRDVVLDSRNVDILMVVPL